MKLQIREKWRHVKLQIVIFFEKFLFDVLNGTDTHVEVQKIAYAEKPDSLNNGTYYSASYTTELKKSFRIVRELLGEELAEYKFVDVGCGKGKAVIAWKLLCLRNKINQPVMGFDYSESLIRIARTNYRKVLKEEGHLVVADAVTFNYAEIGEKLIIYLFNPFDEVIFQKFLDSIKTLKTIIIYNNPNHQQIVVQNGWTEFHCGNGILGFNRTVMSARNITDISH